MNLNVTICIKSLYIYSESKRDYMYKVTFRVTVRTRWRSWLRHCTISRKVACSIPDGIIGTFRWLNPSGRIMTVGSTQPVTEVSTMAISLGLKVTDAYG